MKNTKKIFMLLIFCLVQLCLTGCSDKKAEATTENEETSSTEVSAEEAPEGLTYRDVFDLNLVCVPYIDGKANLLQNTITTIQSYLENPASGVKSYDIEDSKNYLYLVEITMSNDVNPSVFDWKGIDEPRVYGNFKYDLDTAISKYSFTLRTSSNHLRSAELPYFSITSTSFFCEQPFSATHLQYIGTLTASPTGGNYTIEELIDANHSSFQSLTSSDTFRSSDDDRTVITNDLLEPNRKIIIAYEVVSVDNLEKINGYIVKDNDIVEDVDESDNTSGLKAGPTETPPEDQPTTESGGL